MKDPFDPSQPTHLPAALPTNTIKVFDRNFWRIFISKLKVLFWFTRTKINKKLNWTPLGVLKHFPSGDKLFGDTKIGRFSLKNWNLNSCLSNTYKMERLSGGPSLELLSSSLRSINQRTSTDSLIDGKFIRFLGLLYILTELCVTHVLRVK